MAAGDLPPYVVSGQPIASAWGNATVDELLRKRNEVEVYWTHPGGNSAFMGACSIGKTTLGPFAYPVQMRLIATIAMGYSGCGVACSAGFHTFNGSGDIGAASQYIHAAYYAAQTIVGAWPVAAGQDASFQTICNWNATETTGVSVYFSAQGLYRIQRTGTP